MQRVCKNCNTLVSGDGSFCPSCGAPLPEAENSRTQHAEEVRSTGDPHHGTMPDYGVFQEQKKPEGMSVGQWVLTVICTTYLGFFSLIFCLVWSFSSTTPVERKRYCRAMLIIQCALLVLQLIFLIVFVAMIVSSGTDIDTFYNQFIQALENSPV